MKIKVIYKRLLTKNRTMKTYTQDPKNTIHRKIEVRTISYGGFTTNCLLLCGMWAGFAS